MSMDPVSKDAAAPTSPPVEEVLEGGGVNHVTRVGDTVRRPAHPWTTTVHALLHHLREAGFTGAPAPLGFDEQGREVLEFMPGAVGHYPLSQEVKGEIALRSAARLLRAYHDATEEAPGLTSDGWQLPPLEPVEVVCHSDFAPYNCVFRDGIAVAMFDFDFARPGPRAWDLAYALYRFAPLAGPTNPDTFGEIAAQADRARQFLDAYGADPDLRGAALAMVVPRVGAMVEFMREAADHGDEAFARHIAEGHLDLYLDDIAYVEAHRALLNRVVVED